MKINRTVAAIAALITASGILTGCGGDSSSASGDTGDKLTVGVIPGSNAAALYVAEKEGLFKDGGLTMSFEIQQNAAAIVPSVLNGQLQIGVAATSPFLTAVDKGLPLVIVTGQEVSPDSPDDDPSSVFVKGGSGIDKPADLSGKKIAVNALGAALELSTRALIDDDGGDSSTSEFIALTFPQMQEAVGSGQVDAAVVIEPFQTGLEKAGLVDVGHPFTSANKPGDSLSVYFTSKKFEGEHAETLSKFRVAMAKAVDMIKKDANLARSVIPGFTGIDAAVVENMTINQYSNEVPTEGLERLSAEMVKYGFARKKLDPETVLPKD